MPTAVLARTLASFILRPRLPAMCVVAALCLLGASSRSPAVDTLTLNIGDVQGEGWKASDVAIAFELGDAGQLLLRLNAKRLTTLPELGAITDLEVECRDPVVIGSRYGCDDAKLRGVFGRLGHDAARNGDAGLFEQTLRLIFVNLHSG